MGAQVLVVGNSAREHAIAWKLRQSPKVDDIFLSAPNSGIRRIACALHIETFEALCAAIREHKIDLVVVGPEGPLSENLADIIRDKTGVPVFGPSARSARIETSKVFAKELMRRAGIPTAPFIIHDAGKIFFADSATKITPPYVVKADGLAGGKGVEICKSVREVNEAILRLRTVSERFVIERFLEGEEISYHLPSDGTGLYLTFPPSQDRKKLNGKNTGGMGAVAPVTPLVGDSLLGLVNSVFTPALNALYGETGEWFRGCLYPGLMLTTEGPAVLEFNARFGDPEMQAYVRIIESDLFELLMNCAQGNLKAIRSPIWRKRFAVCVVLASEGYPDEKRDSVHAIHGISEAEEVPGVKIFFAGVEGNEPDFYTRGGKRVLSVTASGVTLEEAIERAYSAVRLIHFEGMQYLPDIGQNLIGRI